VFKHLKKIFESGELDEKAVVSSLEITTQHGAIAEKTQVKTVKKDIQILRNRTFQILLKIYYISMRKQIKLIPINM
jgi:hypothetical protein